MEPNYSTYSLDELIDIESNIDKELYPERYKKVCEFIILLQNDTKEAEKIELKKKSSKVNRLLYGVSFFWLFSFLTLLTGEFKFKGYSASYADNPVAFFCGVALYFGCGLYIYLMYIKQSKQISEG